MKECHIYIHSLITPEHHEKLEEALAQVIRDFGLEGELRNDYTGNSIFIAIENKASIKYDKFGEV